MITGRAVPFVAAATLLPPPAAAFLNPNPLTTQVGPLPAGHLERREHKGMLVAIGRDSLTDDNAGIADRFRHCQDTEIALRKIAKRVEIKQLAVGVKECVLGVVTRGR